jgi:hypothetical protein
MPPLPLLEPHQATGHEDVLSTSQNGDMRDPAMAEGGGHSKSDEARGLAEPLESPAARVSA